MFDWCRWAPWGLHANFVFVQFSQCYLAICGPQVGEELKACDIGEAECWAAKCVYVALWCRCDELVAKSLVHVVVSATGYEARLVQVVVLIERLCGGIFHMDWIYGQHGWGVKYHSSASTANSAGGSTSTMWPWIPSLVLEWTDAAFALSCV